MNKHWDISYLAISVDMAGCPNRCRHCWIGNHRNGNIGIEQFKNIVALFKNWQDENGIGIKEFTFLSWWREPDYRGDYRELWALEQQLSSPGRAERFELLSTWRLARDKSYAFWAATLPPKACQITFFGMEDNTDWFMRRKGAFCDQLIATDRLIDAGITPRWQLFLTKRCLHELGDFLRFIYDLKLHKRCEEIGGKFEIFIGGMSPKGSGYELDNIRVDVSDLYQIPEELISICREGINMLGHPECTLIDDLRNNYNPPGICANIPCLSVNADYDVYPNIAEAAEWWRLGNLRADGIDKILKAYRNETTPGMKANRTIPLAELSKRYGDPYSKKLYDKSDLVRRFMHQWGKSL